MMSDLTIFLKYWVKQSAINVVTEIKKPFKSLRWTLVWILFFLSFFLATRIHVYYTVLLGILGLIIIGMHHYESGEWKHQEREELYSKLGIERWKKK